MADMTQTELRAATPSEIASRDLPRADVVTSVIEHDVKPGCEAEYEKWLSRITPIANRFPGHRGISFVAPTAGNSKYTLLLQFDNLEHTQDWFQSAARRELIDEIKPLLKASETVELKTGLEFWFRSPAGKSGPSPLKQSIVTLVVLYPLTLIVPKLWGALSEVAPPLGNQYVANLAIDATIVALLTYVIMPPVTRLLSRWLYA
jgi:antibiotic biosynthesis monooxygenase (ABM) superfamily enzyme